MRVTNWRRTLAANLAALGLLTPSAAWAANLNENLVVNPGFENVDLGVTCCYQSAAAKFNSWADGSMMGFAYNNELPELNGSGDLGWDDGGPLQGGGLYFFGPASGNEDGTYQSVTSPGLVSQNLNVSTGPTGTLIASGEAAVVLSGFFTSYNGQDDRHGTMQVDFLNAGGTSLGSTDITSQLNPNPWHQERGAAVIPVGTATLRTSLFGNNFNAYIDNVDVQVTEAANEVLYLEVNTTTGQTAIKNQSGDAFHIDYYRVRSAGGTALNATAWNSLQEQNLAGFPAGNGSGNGWEQFGGSSSGVVGESYLTGNSIVANSTSVGLGAAFNVGGAHDLTFQYAVISEVELSADFDGDGDADGNDFLAWQRGLGTLAGATKAQGDADGDMDVDADDLAAWKGDFGRTRFSGPGVLQNGFVRYVTGAAAAVPEPSPVLLVGLGLASLAGGGWRPSRRAVSEESVAHG